MFPPTFNSVALFGIEVVFSGPQINPIEHQTDGYAGLDGVEDKRLGERGAWTTVTGRLVGPAAGQLNNAVGTFRSATRWGKCVLVDPFGNGWPFVRLDTFQTTGRIMQDGTGALGYNQTYEARFFHAVLP